MTINNNNNNSNNNNKVVPVIIFNKRELKLESNWRKLEVNCIWHIDFNDLATNNTINITTRC